jgi:hypothetical protein
VAGTRADETLCKSCSAVLRLSEAPNVRGRVTTFAAQATTQQWTLELCILAFVCRAEWTAEQKNWQQLSAPVTAPRPSS